MGESLDLAGAFFRDFFGRGDCDMGCMVFFPSCIRKLCGDHRVLAEKARRNSMDDGDAVFSALAGL